MTDFLYLSFTAASFRLNRFSSVIGSVTIEDDGKEFSDPFEPLPECTLAFTHGIGNEVTNEH